MSPFIKVQFLPKIAQEAMLAEWKLFHEKVPGVYYEKLKSIMPVALMTPKIIVANWLETGVQIRPI